MCFCTPSFIALWLWHTWKMLHLAIMAFDFEGYNWIDFLSKDQQSRYTLERIYVIKI